MSKKNDSENKEAQEDNLEESTSSEETKVESEEKMDDVNGILDKEEKEVEVEKNKTKDEVWVEDDKDHQSVSGTETKDDKSHQSDSKADKEESSSQDNKTEAKKEDSWNFDEEGSSGSSFGWKIISGILLILLVASIYSDGFNFTGAAAANVGGELTLAQAEKKALDYVNSNLLSAPYVATAKSSEDSGNLYMVTLEVAGQEVNSYITKDGNFFFPQGFDTTVELSDGLPQDPNQKADLVAVSVDDDPMKGDENAPVTIIEFSEYECPFCKKYVDETYPQLVKDYVDTGKVKYVFRDFPLGFHAEAKPAAMASECAHEQDKFWEYHDLLFANQDKLGTDNYKKWAQDLGLDETQFNDCFDSEKYKSEVEADSTEGQSYGVSGTPAFFINGKLISGAQPYSVFKQEIEAALSADSGSDLGGTEEPAVVGETKEVNLVVKKWRFDPNKVTVNEGDTVKLVVDSSFDLDFLLPGLGVDEKVLGGETKTIEFTADQAGTFEFKCGDFCTQTYGEVQGSALTGSLIVE